MVPQWVNAQSQYTPSIRQLQIIMELINYCSKQIVNNYEDNQFKENDKKKISLIHHQSLEVHFDVNAVLNLRSYIKRPQHDLPTLY